MARRLIDPFRLFVVVIGVAALGCGGSDMADDPSEYDEEQAWLASHDMELIPSSMSRERAAILPTTPSEDARNVLGTIDLPAPERLDDEDRDYLPAPAVSWIVDAQLVGDPSLDPKQVSGIFYQDRYKEIGRFVIYGRDVDTGRWTYLIAADGPRAVDRLKFSFDYIDVVDAEAPPPDRQVYEERLAALTEGMQDLGEASTSASLPPAEAAERSKLLVEILRDLDMTAVLALEAPEGQPFDAKQVWDVMLCLGLEWGDMDCFHWQNLSGVGDDSFFSVETTTPPGYFLPEDIAEGGVELDDLVFVYSVPRNARPVETFEAMLRAAQYCRQRLGGTIVDEEGDAVDAVALREEIADVADRLRAAGFEPGADATLQLF